MLKMALFDCAINEKCCSVYGGRGICPLFPSPPRGIWQLKSPLRRKFAIQGKKNANVRGSARGDAGRRWKWLVHKEFEFITYPFYLQYLVSFALFEMVSSENHQYTLKLSQPLTKNKTKKRRIVLKSYLTAARQGLHRDREAILMAFSDMQISKTRELKITCMHNSRQYIQYIQRNLTFCINMNLMNRPIRS